MGVDDGDCETIGGPYDICANDTGQVAVDGEPEPKPDAVEIYDVQAYTEPDGDSLSWDWTITDVSTGDPVTVGWTDNSDGSIEVDWAAVGVVEDDEFTIDCDITDMCQTIPADTLDIVITNLFKESFDTDPADWAYAEFWWEDWCPPYPGVPAWTNIGPNGPSGSGNVRYPTSGNFVDGGTLATIVTPPFDIPASASEICLRVYASMGVGGSWDCYHGANWKIVESSTPGIAPFVSGDPAPLPGGGAYLQNSLAHGSTGWGLYLPDPIYCFGPLFGQPGWEVDHGGGAFPGSLTQYLDLIIPPSFYGLTVKVCFQFQPDECAFAGSGVGIALDDYELMVY